MPQEPVTHSSNATPVPRQGARRFASAPTPLASARREEGGGAGAAHPAADPRSRPDEPVDDAPEFTKTGPPFIRSDVTKAYRIQVVHTFQAKGRPLTCAGPHPVPNRRWPCRERKWANQVLAAYDRGEIIATQDTEATE